jgi:hypothetical protein
MEEMQVEKNNVLWSLDWLDCNLYVKIEVIPLRASEEPNFCAHLCLRFKPTRK